MAKKYDTNPLDRDVSRRAERARLVNTIEPEREISEAPTAVFEAQTRQFVPAVPTAEVLTEPLPTQPGQTTINEPYNSVFNRPPTFSSTGNLPDASVSSAVQKLILPPTSRKVLGLGLPEKVAMMLPYLPWLAGAVVAVIVLLCASKTETRVRFHAAQALALHLVSWIIGVVLTALNEFLPFSSLNGKIFTVAVTIYFIVSLYRVWKGKPNHIEALDDVTDFLNEKIKPQTK